MDTRRFINARIIITITIIIIIIIIEEEEKVQGKGQNNREQWRGGGITKVAEHRSDKLVLQKGKARKNNHNYY